MMRSDIYLFSPILSILLFIGAMGGTLWMLNQRDLEQQRDALLRDLEWAQQNVLLKLQSNQDKLVTLAREVGQGGINEVAFRAFAKEILLQNPELVMITRIDADRTARWVGPAETFFKTHVRRKDEPDDQLEPFWAFERAKNTRQTIYTRPFVGDDDEIYVEMQAPVVRQAQFLGTIGALYSVRNLLKYSIPNDFSKKYKVSIVDGQGNLLASSTPHQITISHLSSELPFDPPGYGILLKVESFTSRFGLINNMLFWLVGGLSMMTLWSLWSLSRHIRQRNRTQKALMAETSFRRAMEDSMVTGMCATDLDGLIIYANRAFCDMVGWKEADLLQMPYPYEFWLSEDHLDHAMIRQNIREGQIPQTGFELRLKRRNGSVFYARLHVSPLIDSSGRQTGWMSAYYDITEPKRIRVELAAAQERFTTVLEALDAAVSVFDYGRGELLFANRYYRTLFKTDTSGHTELAGSAPPQSNYLNDSLDNIDSMAGLPTSALTDVRSNTQEVFVSSIERWFEVRLRYIQWVDGRVAQMQIATDVTARKTAEEKIRQEEQKAQFTSRLMTMGEMASSIAHELNQPLTAITNYSMGTVTRLKAEISKLIEHQPELVMATAADEDRQETNPLATMQNLLPALEKTSQQAQRAGMIIRRIREFVKRSEPNRRMTDVKVVVADAIGLAEIEASKRNIKLKSKIEPELPAIFMDPILIEQVLVNLLRNAAEAMGSHPEKLRADAAVKLIIQQNAGYIEFTVLDQGPGIEPGIMDRLFEPFFSTKQEGMGMGLNICRSIIEFHEGRLWAENVLQEEQVIGCAFRFTLPVKKPSSV